MRAKEFDPGLTDLLDVIDAAPLITSGFQGGAVACVSCGGKCYQGCKATVTPSEDNMPNAQPSLDRDAREVEKSSVSKESSKRSPQ